MNLQSKKARIPIAALGVTALCTAGLGVIATSASAATPLTLNPSDTTVSITDVDPTTSNITAATAYGLALGAVTPGATHNVYVVATGPSGAASTDLYVQRTATATAPTAAGFTTTIPLATTLAGATGTSVVAAPAATDNYYIGAKYPGAYTLKFYQEGGGSASSFDGDNIDNAAPTITLNVKDVNNKTASTADDLGVSVATTPSAVDKGEGFSSKVTVSGLSTTDVRGVIGGGNPGGQLANALRGTDGLNGPLTLSYTPTGGSATAAALTYDGTTFNATSAAQSTVGSVSTLAAIGSGVSATATNTVNDSGVTALSFTDADTANVDYTETAANGTAVVRAGSTTMTFKAKATKTVSGVVTPVSGAKVFFRFSGFSGLAKADITSSGANPDAQNDLSATTDADGIATLTVTFPTAKAIAGNTFTVTPRSNSATVGTTTNVAVSFLATAAGSLVVNNATAVVGGTATLTGKVVDQWGEAYAPAGTTVALANTGSAPDFTGAGNYPIASDGSFSATVSDVAANTTPRVDAFTWTITGLSAVAGSLSWRASITPGSLTASTITINDGAPGTATTLPFAATTTKVDIAHSATTFAGDVETLQGVLKDNSTGAGALPYTSVTYSGSDGVLFYDRTNKLVKTLTAKTEGTGALSYDGSTAGVRILFTKTGSATLTALAGSATAAVSVLVEDATDSFKVSATDAMSKPGQSVTLSGKVVDAFGNPVVGRQVTLVLDVSTAGSLSGTDANTTTAGLQVVTDSQGVWSTPFTSTSNQKGTVTLTATLTDTASPPVNLTTNPTAATLYTTAGLTVAHGEYQTTAKIEVAETFTEIAVTSSLLGGGKAQITGTAEAGAAVDLYSRPSGASGFELVKTLNADADGTWGVGTTLSKTTSFFARSNGKTSSSVTTVVYSTQTVKAKALGKGKVRFTVLGTPNVKGVVNIYYGSKRLAHVSTDSHGDVTVDVQAKAGKRTFVIYFVAPGTSLKGRTLTGTVK